MRKSLFILPLLGLNMLAISSCGKSEEWDSRYEKIDEPKAKNEYSNPKYSNQLDKGNSVDSININYNFEGGERTITFNSTDSWNSFYTKFFIPSITELKPNYPLVKTKSEEIKELRENNYKLTYDDNLTYCVPIKKETKTNVLNSNITIYDYDNNNSKIFLIGDYYNSRHNTIKENKNTMYSCITEEQKDAGLYYNKSKDNLIYARNILQTNDDLLFDWNKASNLSREEQLQKQQEVDELFDEHKAIFYNGNPYDKIELNDSYIVLSTNLSFLRNRDLELLCGYYFNYDDTLYPELDDLIACESKNDYNEQSSLYDCQFELTDKYIIVKTKFDTLADFSISKKCECYYIYEEMWFDYKNFNMASDYNTRNTYSYSYYKYDYVKEYNNIGIWAPYDKENDAIWKKEQEEKLVNVFGFLPYYSGAEKLEYKDAEETIYNEIHMELYNINISEDAISSKKNDYLDYCQKNNFLDDYTYTGKYLS